MFSASRILQPVRYGFILFSLILAFAGNLIPRTGNYLWLPDLLALVLIFWSVREPRLVGMGTAFMFGLLMDVAYPGLMGQHALAYVFASYLAGMLSRRILWFPMMQQALHILPLLLLVQGVQLAVRMTQVSDWPGLSYLLGPFIGFLLWGPLSFILLIPQYRPVERDDNRPI